MDAQVIVEYGCEDGMVTVYGAKSEEGWLFWRHVGTADLDDNDEVGSSPRSWAGPKTANLSEAVGKNWIFYNPVSIHPDFLPWFRQAYDAEWAQLPVETRLQRKDSRRSWQELLWSP